MQTVQKDETAKGGSETTGAVIRWTPQHDIFSSLVGLGVNGANSRMIVEMAHINPGHRVLDVGCGTGDLTLTAQRYVGASVSAYGIDASREGIEIARKKAAHGKSGTVFEVGLIERIPYEEATFDVVISRLVIHHLPDDLKRSGLAEMFRVLKPGGLVFIADFKVPGNPILAHLILVFVGHHMMMQSNVSTYPQMLRQAGFIGVDTGPTRSAFLDFVSGRKPTS